MPQTQTPSPRCNQLWCLGLALLIGLAGCSDSDNQASNGSSARQVVIGEPADVSNIHPLYTESQTDSHVASLLYRSLLWPVWRDGRVHYATADENPQSLTRRYEIFGTDSASIRFHLDSTARYSDGTPVTARDAAYNLRIRGTEAAAAARFDFNREMREIVVEDDSTLVIHFNRRYPEMLFHSSIEVVPEALFEGTAPEDLRSHPAVLDPAGNFPTSGPMRVAAWNRGQSIVLEPNPYFEPQLEIDRVVFRVIPEETTRMIELETGNIDITEMPMSYAADVRVNPNLRIETMAQRAYEYVAYNPLAYPFFDDVEIRRALTMALDREALIDALELGEFAVPAGGPYSPLFSLLYDPEAQGPLPYDTAAANAILDERGWVRGPDGVRQRDGQRMAFQLSTNANNRRRVDIAQVLENQWARIGVQASIQTLEFNTFYDRAEEKDFDAMIAGWNVALSPDLFAVWGDPENIFNFVSYDNPEVQELFRQAVDQPTEEAAAQYWREAASVISAEQPYTWLFFYDLPFAINNRVQGVVVNTLSPLQDVWRWRIVDDN